LELGFYHLAIEVGYPLTLDEHDRKQVFVRINPRIGVQCPAVSEAADGQMGVGKKTPSLMRRSLAVIEFVVMTKAPFKYQRLK
jgi:hypothetical protein